MPLRRQLAAGLEAAIRDGHVAPGSRLPSTRDMARRLGVHRSTVRAAYARLRRHGCVAGGSGGRLRVPGPPASGSDDGRPDAGPSGDDPAMIAVAAVSRALEEAMHLGVSRRSTLVALSAASGRFSAGEAGPPLPMLFEPRPGLRSALAAELRERLGIGFLAPAPSSRVLSGCQPVLARGEVASRLRAAGRGPPELVRLHVSGGTRERGHARRAARGGLVTVVSVSRTVRRHARELGARDFGRGVSVAAVDPSDTGALWRAASASRLVLYDEASRSALPTLRVTAVPIRLIPDRQISALRAYFDAPRVASRGRGHESRRGT